MMSEGLGDRRAAVRFDVSGDVWGSLETMDPMPMRNIGRGGILVETPHLLKPESFYRMHLVLAGSESIVEGQVRHVTAIRDATSGDRYLIGFKFVTVEPATLEYIDRLVTAGDRSTASEE